MTASDFPGKDKLEIRMQKRISEIERSNQELRAEILERKQEKHRINRYNNVLEGINRIFASVIKAETEGELGNKCLSIAIDITGSQIGFVGMVGADGLLHDIAISDMGWEQCLMHDDTGHCCISEDLILQGLYGHVIDSGKSFFTNDPLSHLKGIVMPEGHPLLTSFLAVPLILDGKTVGIVCVANCEDGYNIDQQEDLEAIVPAIMQALQRKKYEEALHDAYEKIHIQSEELQASNEELQAQNEELKEACEALSENEKLYRMLFTNMTEGFVLLDVSYNKDSRSYEYRYLDINPVYEKSTGIKREQALGKPVLEVFPDISPKVVEKLDETALSGQSTNFEIFSQVADRYFEINMFSPEEGKIASIFRDITERKLTEQALRESKAQLFAFLDQLPVGLGLADTQGRLLVSNSIFCSFKGDIVLSRPDNSWRWRAWGADGHLLDRSEWPFSRAFQGESVNPGLDFLYTTDDGEEIWTRVSAVPFRNEDGEIKGAVSVIEDIDKQKRVEEALKKARSNLEEKVKERTAELEKAYNLLKESEERFRISVKNTKFVLSQFDSNLRYTWIYNPHPDFDASLLTGKRCDEIENSDEMRRFTAFKKQVLKSGKGIHEELSFSRSDGMHTYDTIIEPLYSDTGDVIGGTVSALDVTDRKKAEEALAKIEIARQKEIHHRIKNNLQVISSLLDLQAEKFNNRKCIEDLEVIEAFRESQDRVMSIALIHEELHESKETDKLNFSLYLHRLVENLFHTYRLENINVSLYLDLEDRIFFDMDTAVPLGMIVNEIVSNSFKHAFSGKDGGEIKIILNRKKDTKNENTKYVLTVSDNGIGISENVDFENPDSLGLQLVNILVDQLDGYIELKRDEGTEFTICFSDIEK